MVYTVGTVSSGTDCALRVCAIPFFLMRLLSLRAAYGQICKILLVPPQDHSYILFNISESYNTTQVNVSDVIYCT